MSRKGSLRRQKPLSVLGLPYEQLGFYAGVLIANDSRLPALNSGDGFEAARKKALAEAEYASRLRLGIRGRRLGRPFF